MAKEKLTDKQEDTIGAINQYKNARNDLPPTRSELSRMLGISINAVADRLKLLVRKGHLEIIPNIARGIIVL